MAGLWVAMTRLGMNLVRLFATLQRGVRFKLPASMTNSYDGAGIARENRARLDGSSNIGRNGTHEGKNNDTSKSSELRKCVSRPWFYNLEQALYLHCYVAGERLKTRV